MLKIGYVSTYPPTHCGVAEYTGFLSSALKSVYPQVKLYVFSDIGEGRSEVREDNGAEIRPSFGKGSQNYQRILDELSAVDGVDVLHVQHEYGIFGHHDEILKACIEAKKEKLAKKLVLTLHSVYHPLSGDSGALEFQKKLNSADAVIIHSYLMEFELQNQGLDPLLIRRIPHGTFLNPYLDDPRQSLLAELNLREQDLSGVVLTTIGFLRRDKGLDLLIKSINALEYRRGSITLLIAGESRISKAGDKEILDVIEDVSRKLNIILINRYLSRDEILKTAALSDIIVLPYHDKPALYSVSGILHLSMGSFKPLIGTRVPRLIELYQFAPRATVPPRSPRQFSKSLRWCIRNYEHMVAYMATLYGYAIRTQWMRMARRHLSLYRELLAA